jgi:hypothetical protein
MDSKTLCLGSLKLGDTSGYEIKKMIEVGCFAQYRGLIECIESLLNLGLLAGQLWARGLGLAFYRASADYLDQHRAMLIPAPVKTRNRSDLVVEDEDI